MADDGLTDQQRRWMASVRASLESSTGRSLAEWVEIGRACPETKPKARQRWFKEVHGLGQNYAMMVMHEMERASGEAPRSPSALSAALWSDPSAAAVRDAIQAAVDALPQAVTGQRKTYTTWSRNYAFAAARPVKGGAVRLGLAVDPAAHPMFEPARKEGWSERLTASLTLTAPGQVEADFQALLRAAWDAS
jgi:hypothetical protein